MTPRTHEATARALAQDVVRQWFSRSLGAMKGWEKWRPIWEEQLTMQFTQALEAQADAVTALLEEVEQVKAERDAWNENHRVMCRLELEFRRVIADQQQQLAAMQGRVKALGSALRALLVHIDLIVYRDGVHLRLGDAVPQYVQAQAALDAARTEGA